MGKALIVWLIAIVSILVLVFVFLNVAGDDSSSSLDIIDDDAGGFGDSSLAGDDDNTVVDGDGIGNVGCGQANPEICTGLTDGTVVDSCDSCNTCTCLDGGASCTEIACNDVTDGEGDDTGGNDDNSGGNDVPQLHTINMDSSGFSPSVLEIRVGDIVTFEAVDDSGRWPASDVHPTHTRYPGSDIGKCGTAEESGIFDSCRAIAEGESFAFIFEEAGSWGYHDHLRANEKGTIIVN